MENSELTLSFNKSTRSIVISISNHESKDFSLQPIEQKIVSKFSTIKKLRLRENLKVEKDNS